MLAAFCLVSTEASRTEQCFSTAAGAGWPQAANHALHAAHRGAQFAGTRYRKRGVSDQGYVANDVETEQVPLTFSFYSPLNRAGAHDTDWGTRWAAGCVYWRVVVAQRGVDAVVWQWAVASEGRLERGGTESWPAGQREEKGEAHGPARACRM